MKFNQYYLYFFFSLFLIFNIFFIIFYPGESGDSTTIKIVAKNILINSCISLSDPLSGKCLPHWGSNQGLGYPYIISLSYYFFGENLNPVRILQLIMHMLSIFFLIFQIKKFYSANTSNFFIVFLFISPLTMGWHRSILTESINSSFVITLMGLMLPLFFNKKFNPIILGIILALGFYIRYDYIFFIIPITLILFYKLNFRLFIFSCIKVSIVSLILVTPYLYRNYKVGLELIPPTQLGLHVEGAPLSPMGYIEWVTTWSSTNYMYANALYPLDYGNYDEIKINKKAYFNENQEKIILDYLNILKDFQGKPIPENIDKKFQNLANYNKEKHTFYVYLILPVKRMFALWFNPVTSLGYPGSFNNISINYDFLINLKLQDKIGFIKENFLIFLSKIINFLYRILLILGFGYIFCNIFYNKKEKLKPVLYFVSSFFILKTIFLSFTFYTATRHIISSAILIEILIIFFLIENETK